MFIWNKLEGQVLVGERAWETYFEYELAGWIKKLHTLYFEVLIWKFENLLQIWAAKHVQWGPYFYSKGKWVFSLISDQLDHFEYCLVLIWTNWGPVNFVALKVLLDITISITAIKGYIRPIITRSYISNIIPTDLPT